MKAIIPNSFILFISLIVLLIFSCFSVQAQDTIKYNFYNNKLESGNLIVNDGENIIFKVEDVNPFLYKVTIESIENEYNITIPNLISSQLIEKSTKSNKTEKKETNPEGSAYAKFISSVEVYEGYKSDYKNLKNFAHKDGLSIEKIISEKNKITNKNDEEFISNIENNITQIVKYRIESISEFKDDDTETKVLKAKYEELKETDFKNLSADMRKLLNKINNESFSFVVSPIQADKDEIVYEIKIEPINNDDVEKYGSGYRKVYFKVPVQVLNRWKIDFSTGLFISSLIDHKFALMKDNLMSTNDTISGYKILRNNEGNFKLGFLALAHVYKRVFPKINVAINLGVGIIPNQSVSYLLGGSVIFGYNNRIIINGGLTLGSVERLSPLIKENNFYTEIPLNELTVNEFNLGGYFGISYNLNFLE